MNYFRRLDNLIIGVEKERTNKQTKQLISDLKAGRLNYSNRAPKWR